MFSEDGEVFEDNTIVEFKYDMTRENKWRWIPIHVRNDKTTELRQGVSLNFGNAYHVAESNWKSIHNPVTQEMIATGVNIPDVEGDSDVYYNRLVSSNKTMGLRNFHNFIKYNLIKAVSKKGETLIDYACGKAGDFPKWIDAQLSFVFGIDKSKDNLENRIDGACARFLNYRKTRKHIPYALLLCIVNVHDYHDTHFSMHDYYAQSIRIIILISILNIIIDSIAIKYLSNFES
jgi:hypothetical protein